MQSSAVKWKIWDGKVSQPADSDWRMNMVEVAWESKDHAIDQGVLVLADDGGVEFDYDDGTDEVDPPPESDDEGKTPPADGSPRPDSPHVPPLPHMPPVDQGVSPDPNPLPYAGQRTRGGQLDETVRQQFVRIFEECFGCLQQHQVLFSGAEADESVQPNWTALVRLHTRRSARR